MNVTKTNKEIIDRLQKFFLTQDPSVVARCLANTMIDIQRFMNFKELDSEELASLIGRSYANIAQLEKFIKNGPGKKLDLHNIADEGS